MESDVQELYKIVSEISENSHNNFKGLIDNSHDSNFILFSLWWDTFWEIWDRTNEINELTPYLNNAFKKESSVVDVGCADMLLFNTNCLPLPFRYIGIEPNPILLNCAKKRNPDIVIKQEYGSKLSLPDSISDLTLCLWVLHYPRDIQGILKECKRITKPNGKIIISIPDIDSPLYKNIFKLACKINPDKHIFDPNLHIKECINVTLKNLTDTQKIIKHFSGYVHLFDKSVFNIPPLFVFFYELLKSQMTDTQVLSTLLENIDLFNQLPSFIEDKVLFIESTV